MLYGVPRTMKLSAAGPHASRSQARFDSKPPEAATTERARISWSAPLERTVADVKRPSRSAISTTSLSYETSTPSASAAA